MPRFIVAVLTPTSEVHTSMHDEPDTHPLCEPPFTPMTSAQLASAPAASSSSNGSNSRSYVPSGRQT